MITKEMITAPHDTPDLSPSRKVGQSHFLMAMDTGHLNHGDAAVETVVQEQLIRHVSCVYGAFLLTGGPLPNATAPL
jgi:hypothetical protein